MRLNRTWGIVLLLSLSCTVQAQTADPLRAQVTIYRDTYGVPHIVGETQEATFFGYGYAQAEDHLEEMILQYRDAQGRRAGEVIGFEPWVKDICSSFPTITAGTETICNDCSAHARESLRGGTKSIRRPTRILDGFARA